VTKDDLSARQRRFVAALMTARTIEDAATIAGVTKRTGMRYLADPNVRAAVNEAQAQALAQVTRQAVQAMTEALDVLRGIASDEDAPSGSRVSAARAILENGLRYNEAVTLAERVSELEARMEVQE